MIRWAYIFALFLVPALLRADCPHCGWTVGVKAAMNDGSVITGYVVVSPYMYMNLQNRAEKGLEPFSKLFAMGKVPKWQTVEDQRGLIEPWALLVDAAAKAGKAPEGKLAITTELVKVERPTPVWVAVEGTVRVVEFTDIRSFGLEPALPVRQDATGIESLSRAAVELLKEEPAVSVKIFDSVSDSFLLVYDPGVDLDRLPLDLLVRHEASIEVGGVALRLRGSPQVQPLALPSAAVGLSTDEKKVVMALQVALLRGHFRMMADSTLNSLSYTARGSKLLPEEIVLMEQLSAYLGKPHEERAAGLKALLLQHKIVYYTLGFD